ncbi:MAG: hypothetical protein AABM40_04645 [Chloroflexota bacterium]
MQGTFFFVHGTGVREPTYTQFWTLIQERAKANGFDGVTFVGCPWGPEKGADLALIPATLPAPATRGIPGAPTATELEVALWAALLEDPLFELRVAAQAVPTSVGPAIGGVATPEKAAAGMALMVGSKPLDLTDTGVDTKEIAEAARFVSASRELGSAARAVGKSNDPALVQAVARAIVARVIAQKRTDVLAESHGTELLGLPPAVAANGARRDQLVGDIAEAMSPGTRGIVTDWLRDRLIDFAKPKLTEYLRAQRDPLTRASVSGAADILYYQRRGGEIRKFLTDAMKTAAAAAPPLVAVAHSLGGELLADVLAQDDPPRVDLLVTAGTQISLFHAVDGLETLRPPDGKPPFPRWVNFYDQNDFLSYTAKPTFKGDHIEDIELASGVPFPDAHGAYWHNDELYQEIKQRWP